MRLAEKVSRNIGILRRELTGKSCSIAEHYSPQETVSPEIPRLDIAAINGFIRDETSDIGKYNAAATYLKNPEAKALAVEFGFDEMRHATKWKDLKAKLESELETVP